MSEIKWLIVGQFPPGRNHISIVVKVERGEPNAGAAVVCPETNERFRVQGLTTVHSQPQSAKTFGIILIPESPGESLLQRGMWLVDDHTVTEPSP